MSRDADLPAPLPATPAAHGGPFGKALLRAGFLAGVARAACPEILTPGGQNA